MVVKDLIKYLEKQYEYGEVKIENKHSYYTNEIIDIRVEGDTVILIKEGD